MEEVIEIPGLMFEIRKYQQDIIPAGLAILRKYYMVWLTGEERAGKTVPALGIIKEGGFKRALCITTLKAAIDIKKVYGSFADHFELDFINYESVHKVVAKKDKYQIVWIDESHKLGQAPVPAQVVKTVRLICENKYIIYSSATPSAEGFYKLYHQFYVSSASPLAKWPNFYAFAKEFINITTRRVSAGREVKVYTDAKMDKLSPLINHLFITWTREDAGFKVNAEDHFHCVKMSDQCIQIFNRLNRDKMYQAGDGAVATVSGGGDLLNKLSQIGSGTLIFDGETDGRIIDASKAEHIKQFFHSKKIAIFYKYIAEGKLLRAYFPNHTDDAAHFNTSGSEVVFIGQVRSFCEGVDLSSADCLINYNLDHSATVYSQSRARILSYNRTKPAPVYYIFSEHGIDNKIYQAVSSKRNFTLYYYQNHVGKSHSIKNNESINQTRLVGAPASSGI